MAKLEIRTPDGRSEVRRLSRRSPLIVGRNPISDVRIDDDAVAPIHCRLSWNGKAFEVTAVSPDGVDVNGVLVRRKDLSEGDLIRVGAVDLVLLNGSGDKVKSAAAAGKRSPARPSRPARDAEPADAEPADEEPVEAFEEVEQAHAPDEIEFSVIEALTPPAAEPPARREEPASPARPEVSDELEILEEPELLDEPEPIGEPAAVAAPAAEPAKRPAEEPRKPPVRPPAGLWGRLTGSKATKRPGEQDVLTSPLVLGFGGLALALVLVAGAIWFLMSREGANRLYAAAEADRRAGRYSQAIETYEKFLTDYPGDRRAADARYALGQARVERYAAGSAPDWDKALAEFDRFARDRRDDRDFQERKPALAKLADSIAAGAAAAATRTGDRKPLAAAEEGRKRFDRFAPPGPQGDEARGRLAAAYDAALAAVRKREYFDAAAKTIEAAVAKNDFAAVYDTRANLLTRYPDLGSDKRVQTLLTRALDAERKLVKPIEVANERRQASGGRQPPESAQPASKPLSLIGHTQARAGEVAGGRLVFAVARDALVALDAVTGRPSWRQPIGLDTPFFPIELDASVPALLAFDAGRSELLLLARADGRPVWRTPVGSPAAGPPLVTQGQIDLATADGRLLRFALETGEPLAAVSFPQPVVGPPVASGERLVLFGDRATAYTLDLRSLEIKAVSFTGQAAGAIDAPPAALGKLVIACENDRLDSAAVRAFTLDPKAGALKQVASERIDGQVRQPPVARGNLLFVPSSPERITAFSVSDDAGQPPLSRLAGVQIPNAQDVPVFLVPGPEGMLWAAGSALRRLRLTADGLKLLDGELAPGRHTQPPQQSGDSLFVARSLPSSPAVYVSQADREAMTGSWRTVLGGAVLAATSGGDAVTLVTDAGQAAIVATKDLAAGGFADTKPLPQWDEASPEPLGAATLSDGRLAAWRAGKTALLWLARPGEPPGAPRPLAGPLETAPVALDGGLVLPEPGRLEWLSESGANVEAFLLPVSGEGRKPPRWQSVVRLDAERLAAADDTGTLRVIRLRREPLPHLAEVASLQLDGPPTRPLAAAGDGVLAASGRTLRLIDSAGLRPVAEVAFETPITGGPWFAEPAVFAQAESGELVALDGERLEERWRLKLDSSAAGPPLAAGDGWIVATQAGALLTLDAAGKETNRVPLAETLTGLVRIGQTTAALGIDGSLHPLASGGRQPPESAPPSQSTPTPEARP